MRTLKGEIGADFNKCKNTHILSRLALGGSGIPIAGHNYSVSTTGDAKRDVLICFVRILAETSDTAISGRTRSLCLRGSTLMLPKTCCSANLVLTSADLALPA